MVNRNPRITSRGKTYRIVVIQDTKKKASAARNVLKANGIDAIIRQRGNLWGVYKREK